MRMKKGSKVAFFLYWQAMKMKSLAQEVFRAWLWVCQSCSGLFPECRDFDAISVLWSRARSFLPCHPGLFAPSQESIAMDSLSSPCFMSKWNPQPKRTEDFVSDSPVTRIAEISTFPTSWQKKPKTKTTKNQQKTPKNSNQNKNFPSVSKTPGKGFVSWGWRGPSPDSQRQCSQLWLMPARAHR